VKANLNSCMRDFNCDSGDCISMTKRCNGVNDCADSSDEANCRVLDNLTDYNANVLTAASGGRASVSFFAEVLNINNIDDKAGQLSVTLTLRVRWQDFRLNFLNLNPNTDLNKLSKEEYDSIWQPDVFFKNKERHCSCIVRSILNFRSRLETLCP
jgi:hypothetical protein